MLNTVCFIDCGIFKRFLYIFQKSIEIFKQVVKCQHWHIGWWITHRPILECRSIIRLLFFDVSAYFLSFSVYQASRNKLSGLLPGPDSFLPKLHHISTVFWYRSRSSTWMRTRWKHWHFSGIVAFCLHSTDTRQFLDPWVINQSISCSFCC